MNNALKTLDGNEDIQKNIKNIIDKNKVVLFMKGTPSVPACGFSQRASMVLSNYNEPIFHINVLEDSAIRNGIKQFSNWPTIPQVYINGKFVGGSDIVQEMHDCGEIAKLLEN